MNTSPAFVMPDGKVYVHVGDVFVSKCIFDMKAYPFDEQLWNFDFNPSGYMARQVEFSCDLLVYLDYFQESGEWKLMNITCQPELIYGVGRIRYVIHLSRKHPFFIINMILPMLLLTFLVVALFWIPSDAGEKLGFGVTLLLSFSVFQLKIAEEIPRTSDSTPFLSKFEFCVGPKYVHRSFLCLTVMFSTHLSGVV